MTIIVSPLSYVDMLCKTRRPSHLVTLLDPDHVIETPHGLKPERHLKLGCHDIVDETEGLQRPDAATVSRLIEFGRSWTGRSPLVVHCWAGISRSTAAGFILACERNPDVSELDIAFEIRRRSRYASPNRRLVALADEMLGRGGRMVEAVSSIGRGEIAVESRPFEIPANW
jgi:predicted protein tyrosine phosphatase